MYHSFSATSFKGPSFLKNHCDPLAGQISNPRVPDLSIDIIFPMKPYGCRLSGLVTSQHSVKVEYIVNFSENRNIFLPGTKKKIL